MQIRHIKPDSPIFPPRCRGKCYCVESVDGPDNDLIHRYLQLDGSWGEITCYFDNEEQIQKTLSKGEKPDFTLSQQELQDRAYLQRMMETWRNFGEW